MADFELPELGEGITEGELVAWKVAVGDTVKDDQPLCEVMTDKATIEVPSPFSGKISALHHEEGDTVNVGDKLVSYDGDGKAASAPAKKESKPAPAPKATPAPAASSGPAPAVSVAPASPPVMPSTPAVAGDTSPDSRVLAAPSVRRLARQLGADLTRVHPTGPGGRVTRQDLENFVRGAGAISAGASQPVASSAPASAAAPAPTVTPAPRVAKTYPQGGEERIKFKGLRKKIAAAMRKSKDNAAHFTYVEEADATELVKTRKAAKEIGAKQGIKVSFLPFVMKAMVAAAREYPIMNSELDEEKNEIVLKHFFNISLSVQTDDGLIAPVIHNVEHKSILELARDIQYVVDRARTKSLTMEDLKGGTITLTNAGSIGGLFATPVINFPEVAILGFNKIFRKPVAQMVNGREEIVIRDWTYFSISLDHRIVDGAIAAEFMKLFIKYIENPGLLSLDN